MVKVAAARRGGMVVIIVAVVGVPNHPGVTEARGVRSNRRGKISHVPNHGIERVDGKVVNLPEEGPGGNEAGHVKGRRLL